MAQSDKGGGVTDMIYPANPEYAQSLIEEGGKHEGTRKLLVDGFPASFSDQQLKDLFDPFGAVVSVIIVTDQTGCSLGFGYVEMSTYGESQRAQKTLHRTTLEDQHLLVIEVNDHIEAEEA
jgi:RNA recognition motif-containing protein